jgi:hypothetical protein
MNGTKKIICMVLSIFVLTIPLTATAAEPGTPEYENTQIADENGLTSDITYTFPSGTVDVTPGGTLLMVNGEFVPWLVEIRDNRSLVPIRFVTQMFGALVNWDDATKTATIESADTIATITIGQQSAEVHKNGAITRQDLYTSAIIINDHTYIPVRALSEIFDKEVGYEPVGLAMNPFVWIDEQQAEWTPDIPAIQEKCAASVELLREKVTAELSDWATETPIATIQQKINDMEVLRYIGRYTFIEGPYKMLVDSDNTVYFMRPQHLIWNIKKEDFNTSDTFFAEYYGNS